MLKKLINRSESSQVDMNDSALRDIIPSNDVISTKKPQQKRFSNICKVLLLIFILGVIAIGIVAIAMIVAFSGKSFMNYIIHSSEENLLPLSNKTRVLTIQQEEKLDKQDWKKITVHIPSSTVRMNTMNDVQLTSATIQTTQQGNRITTVETFTSTFVTTEKIPLNTQYVLQSSTNQNKRRTLLAKYKKFEDDHILDDLLYS